jgi:hypothetical protein
MNSFVFMYIPSLNGGYDHSLVGSVCVIELLTNRKCVGEYRGTRLFTEFIGVHLERGKCLCRGIYGDAFVYRIHRSSFRGGKVFV